VINRILLLGLLLIVVQPSLAQSGMIKTDEFRFASLEGNLVCMTYMPRARQSEPRRGQKRLVAIHDQV